VNVIISLLVPVSLKNGFTDCFHIVLAMNLSIVYQRTKLNVNR
jgi:hypothetical protein